MLEDDFEDLRGYIDDGEEDANSDASVDVAYVAQGARRRNPRVPFATCHFCKKAYFSLDGYKKHLEKHIFYELLDNAPTEEEVISACCEISIGALQEMATNATTRGKGPEISAVVNSLLDAERTDNARRFFVCVGEKLTKCFPGRAFMSSAEFHEKFTSNFASLMSVPNRLSLHQVLEEIVPAQRQIQDGFLLKFMLIVSVKVEAFFLETVCEFGSVSHYKGTASASSRDDENNEDFQQSIHYVGGATLKAVLSKALRAVKSVHWQNIAAAIRAKMLAGDLVAAPPENVSAWTENRDRGGLKHIGLKMWLFFVALTNVLKTVEEIDGSVLHDKVQDEVGRDSVLQGMWNDLLEGSLSADESALLLSEILRSFTNTWGHGVLLRIKNASSISENDKVAFRARLAR